MILLNYKLIYFSFNATIVLLRSLCSIHHKTKPMKYLQSLLGITVAFMLFSFAPIDNSFTGKYSSTLVSLQINEDHTFQYIDNSNSSNKINVSGTWKMGKNSIYLEGYDSSQKIHSKWNVDNKGVAVKSRKGLSFYRLIKEGSCN